MINVSSGYGQLSDLSPERAQLLPVEACANAATHHARRSARRRRHCRELDVPGLGAHRHGRPQRDRSVEEGADTGVWLATEADQSLTGRFFRDRLEIPW